MKTLYKKGENCDTENYRPLSLLSIPSKLLEGQVCHLLDKHLEEAGIGHQNQWGFRKGRSAEGLLLYLTEIWRQALDDNYYVGVLFVDFKKAFDSVNRDILKRKLQAAGICGDMYEWLCDYMDGRKQYTKVNRKKSTIRVIVFGVPQGSLWDLASYLFTSTICRILYLKAIYLCSQMTLLCIVLEKNIEDVIDQLNDAARELYEWCRKNQLTVHTGKTEAMIISHKNFTGPLRPIWFGASIIKYVTQSTSLGITIDNKLSCDKPATKITTSFNTKLKELRRFRYLPTKVKEEIYYKTIVSSITYCISVWGTSSPWILEELDSLHARAARLIYGIKDKLSVSNTFARVKWEPISYTYKRRVLTWMQKMYYETVLSPCME